MPNRSFLTLYTLSDAYFLNSSLSISLLSLTYFKKFFLSLTLSQALSYSLLAFSTSTLVVIHCLMLVSLPFFLPSSQTFFQAVFSVCLYPFPCLSLSISFCVCFCMSPSLSLSMCVCVCVSVSLSLSLSL